MREGKCKYCGEKWDPKPRCLQNRNPPKLYACEAKEQEEILECEDSSKEDIGNRHDYPLELEDDTPNIPLVVIIGMSQP